MKKTTKKLTLNRETLHQLQTDELGKVNGAARTEDGTTCAVGTCCPRSSCLC